jgi:hypothetical protein
MTSLDSLNNIEKNIDYEIEKWFTKNLKNILKHNHPPLQGIVRGCKYCEMFGNVFQHGSIKR